MKVYVAGPYTADDSDGVERNVRAAIEAAVAVIERGHTPYVPHLSHYLDQPARARGLALSWEFWMAYDDEWLMLCDALLYTRPSPGADIEKARAEALGLGIYTAADQLPEADA